MSGLSLRKTSLICFNVIRKLYHLCRCHKTFTVFHNYCYYVPFRIWHCRKPYSSKLKHFTLYFYSFKITFYNLIVKRKSLLCLLSGLYFQFYKRQTVHFICSTDTLAGQLHPSADMHFLYLCD